MVVFNFNGITHDQCRRMMNEIRHGVYNYSLHKNKCVPYSLALALEIGGPRIVTGTVNPKVSVTRVSRSNILSAVLDCAFWTLALNYIFWHGFLFCGRIQLHRSISVVDTVLPSLPARSTSLSPNNMPYSDRHVLLKLILYVPTVSTLT